MATRSNIAVELPDGKIKVIYSHWDGYPTHNGKILKEHYTDLEKVNKLINLGDISELHESVSCPSGHSFSTPVKGHTVFYGRDRGEDDCEPRIVDTPAAAHNQQFLYLFKDGKWLVSSAKYDLIPIEEAIRRG